MSFKFKEFFQYSSLAFPLAFVGIPLYIHAPEFFAVEHGLSLGSLGVILFVLRLIDAIQDPLIGHLSDRWRKNFRWIFLGSGFFLVAGFLLLFSPPGVSPEIKIAWFTFFMFLTTTSFSILTINLNSVGALWKPDMHEQVSIAAVRESLGFVGLLFGVLLPSILLLLVAKHLAFFITGGVMAILLSASLWAHDSWAMKNKALLGQAVTPYLKINQRRLRNLLNSQQIRFFTVYFLSMLASSIPFVLVLFFIRHRLDAANYTGLFLALYFVFGALGMPLWRFLSQKYDPRSAWATAMLLGVISFFWAFWLEPADIIGFALICMVSGVAFAADMVVPPVILTEQVHQERNMASISLFFSFLTFLSKLALALAGLLAFSWLERFNFQAEEVNSPAALEALSFAYAFVPCCIKLISAFLLIFLHKQQKI